MCWTYISTLQTETSVGACRKRLCSCWLPGLSGSPATNSTPTGQSHSIDWFVWFFQLCACAYNIVSYQDISLNKYRRDGLYQKRSTAKKYVVKLIEDQWLKWYTLTGVVSKARAKDRSPRDRQRGCGEGKSCKFPQRGPVYEASTEVDFNVFRGFINHQLLFTTHYSPRHFDSQL